MSCCDGCGTESVARAGAGDSRARIHTECRVTRLAMGLVLPGDRKVTGTQSCYESLAEILLSLCWDKYLILCLLCWLKKEIFLIFSKGGDISPMGKIYSSI